MAPVSKTKKGKQSNPETQQSLTPTTRRQTPSTTPSKKPSSSLAKQVLSNDHEPSPPPLTANALPSFHDLLTAHYTSLNDSVTPHLFFRLCMDYNAAKLDEQGFYIAVYRLLYSTGAAHLMSGFREFLPGLWSNAELGWLNRAIEEEVRMQKKDARKRVGGLLGMFGQKAEVGGGVAAKEDGEVAAKEETSVEEDNGGAAKPLTEPSQSQKKKTPVKGFRSSLVLQDVEQSVKESTARAAMGEPQPRQFLSPASATSKKPTSVTKQTGNSEVSPSKKKATPQVTSETSPETLLSTSHPTFPSKQASTPTTLPTVKKETPNPSASSVPHLGPIYPTTRAILARPTTKPYIHALCGQGFSHPQEIQRHHYGQSGRPGCWEKHGKPAGEQGQWDVHASCKIKITDIKYVKVEGGFVVVDWGSISVPGVREGEEAEVADAQNSGEQEDTIAAETSGRGKGDGVPEADVPEAKRQKTEEVQGSSASIQGGAAVARAAAFRLRARK